MSSEKYYSTSSPSTSPSPKRRLSQIGAGVFADPTLDKNFKRIFREKEILIDFLQHLLPIIPGEDSPIEDIINVANETLPKAPAIHKTYNPTFDIRCDLVRSSQVVVKDCVDIEMQRSSYKFFKLQVWEQTSSFRLTTCFGSFTS
jgi:hypothetical protein